MTKNCSKVGKAADKDKLVKFLYYEKKSLHYIWIYNVLYYKWTYVFQMVCVYLLHNHTAYDYMRHNLQIK